MSGLPIGLSYPFLIHCQPQAIAEQRIPHGRPEGALAIL